MTDTYLNSNGNSGSMERKGDLISNIRYKKEIEIVTFQGKEITLENLSPVFTPEQEAAKRRELEQQLYEVFRKYADKRESEEAGT
jgi:exonuclease I